MPPATPAPTAAAALAIAEKVVLVGASPAYSPDGRWVAFSARPADGSQGPDVYAWRVGQQRAAVLTDDHGSVFSGWVDGRILASAARVVEAAGTGPSDAEPAPDADPASVVARSFLVDPARGTVTALPRDGVWRPVVDPTERIVVYWTGSLAWNDAQEAWIPATGRLVAADWRALLEGGDDATLQPLPRDAVGAAVTDWEVRFDPAGRRLGVWVADPADPGTGRLGPDRGRRRRNAGGRRPRRRGRASGVLAGRRSAGLVDAARPERPGKPGDRLRLARRRRRAAAQHARIPATSPSSSPTDPVGGRATARSAAAPRGRLRATL